jgi:hypothetical protein
MTHIAGYSWKKMLMAATIALAAVVVLALGTAKPAIASEHQFCWGKNLAPGAGCLDTQERYITSVYANGLQGPVCVGTGSTGGCMKAANEGVFAQEPNGGEFGTAFIYHTVNVAGTITAYGKVWDATPPPPPTWHYDNLGGTFTADPAIASWGPNRLDVFGRGSEGGLWHKYWTGSTWSSWQKDVETENIVGGPDAVSWGSGRIDVVAREASGGVNHWYWNNSAWHKDNLGGFTNSDPAISSWGENRLDVFVRGGNNALWHKYWTGAKWSEWEDLGGYLIGGPSAVSWGNDRIDVIGRSSNNSITHWWWDGTSWHSGQTVGATTYQDPSISSTGFGQLDVFYDGTDNALWNQHYNQNNGWSGFTQIGGPIAGGIDSVSIGSRIDVVAPYWDEAKSMAHYYFWK